MRYLLLAVLAGCVAQPKPPSPLDGIAPVSIEKALTPPQKLVLMSHLGMGPQPPEPGSYRIVWPPKLCQTLTGVRVPLIACRGESPTVGVPWSLDVWTTSDPALSDANTIWLVISWRSMVPVDFTSWGAEGCFLLAPMDAVVEVQPGIQHPLISREAAGQRPGRMTLTWTPQADAAGQLILFQPIVLSPGSNSLGLLTGPALEIVVGG